jgi:site-specific DNA-cytosine methylase
MEPDLFVVENVKGLLYLYKSKFLRKMTSGFTKCRYDVCWHILNAKDYGGSET